MSKPFPPDTSTADLLGSIRAATSAAPQAPRRGFGGFSLATAGRGELALAPFVGLYLGYAVVRLPEVFAAFEIPKGPMIMMLIFVAMLALAIPPEAWKQIWERSKPMRLVCVLLGIVVVTMPLGIWPSGSFDFLRQRYLISFVIFLTCLVLLRDRRALRIAAAVFVLSVTAVSANVLDTYDPNALILNEDGEPIDPDVLAARPELRRLATVGIGLDSNDFGAIVVAAFPLALWLSVGSFWRRLFWTGAAGVMVMAVVPTQSRGSMLGLVAAAAVVVGAGARGWRRLLSMGLVAAAVGGFVYMAVKSGAGDRFSDFGGDDYNLGNDGRIFFWKQGMVWMIKRPWGYGIANFPTYFGMLNQQDRAAHSSWVQVGMELGVAGLITFGALCATLIAGLRKMAKAANAARSLRADAAEHEVQAGHMLAMLTGVLVTGSFLSNAYYPMMYMALGLAAATLLGSPFTLAPPPAPSTPEPVPSSGGRRRRILAAPDASVPPDR
ncbi:MAG: O-antigen ligase family protein [Gemmatimonadales bacterium]|nr:O-antigen ligase family protein [Gemmatimonadales bacterium]MBP6570079.1 O-antigen ligase family protein [Gemmatimonadales bacterium]MBP7619721.1 O-antigen ligase family protein [Gemmatimonadales bacterium]MBP9897173.1 O-antigen ligase family protein [Gemmatimonadales bacterium]